MLIQLSKNCFVNTDYIVSIRDNYQNDKAEYPSALKMVSDGDHRYVIKFTSTPQELFDVIQRKIKELSDASSK